MLGKWLIAGIGLLLVHSTALAQLTGGTEFHANLSGAQEATPPPPSSPSTPSLGVDTATSGRLDLILAPDLSSITFQLTVQNGVGVTQAHLHCALPGENGPVVVTLAPLNDQGADVNGLLAEGTRANADIEETAARCLDQIDRPVRNIASLAAAAVLGLIYVNVHTIANPSGEIRGQVIIGDGNGDD
jgi:hypothetical protein